MSKYGFDYFLKRGELVNEMAKPSIWQKMSASEGKFTQFNELYKKIRNSLKGKGEVQRLALDYTIASLMDLDFDTLGLGNIIHQIAKDHIDKNPEAYIQWQENLGKNKGTKYEGQQAKPKKEFLLTDLVKKNIDYAISPEFQEKVLNPDNVEHFVTGSHGRDASAISNQADFEKRRKKDEYGVGLDQYYSETQAGKELIKLINKANRQFTKGKLEGVQNEEEDAATPDVYYAQAVYDELAVIANQKEELESPTEDSGLWGARTKEDTGKKTQGQWRYEFAKTIHSKDLSDLLGYVSGKIDNGFGITEEQMNKLGEIFAQKSPMLKKLIQYLTIIGNNEIGMRKTSDESEDYPGYNALVLRKVLDTPDKLKTFDTWYHVYKNGQAKNFADIKKASSEFLKKREVPEESPAPTEEVPTNNTPEEIPAENDVDSEMAELERKKYDWNLSAAERKAARQRLEELKAEKNGQLSESVMNHYMGEQKLIDSRHTTKKGQFVDRGWKKPINYAHWMSMNND